MFRTKTIKPIVNGESNKKIFPYDHQACRRICLSSISPPDVRGDKTAFPTAKSKGGYVLFFSHSRWVS